MAPHPGPSKYKLGTWLRLGMDKTTSCALLHQGTGGTSSAHTMAGRHVPVLLKVLGPASGVCPALAQELPEVAHRARALAGGVTTCGSSLYLFICVYACLTCPLSVHMLLIQSSSSFQKRIRKDFSAYITNVHFPVVCPIQLYLTREMYGLTC